MCIRDRPAVIAHFLKQEIVVDVFDVGLQGHNGAPVIYAVAHQVGKGHGLSGDWPG